MRALIVAVTAVWAPPMVPDGDAWRTYALGPTTLHVSPDTDVLTEGGVYLLGLLFQSGTRVCMLPASLAAAIIASDGQVLVDAYWGSYLALWRDPRDGAVRILRDPGGSVSLFRFGTGDRALLFTDLDDIWPHLPKPHALDWGGVIHRLVYPQLSVRRTGLADIVQILPGEISSLDGRTPPRLLWSPWRFAARAAPPTRAAADGRSVRDAVETATAALVAQTPVLLELSGGLDSSILAAALDRAGAEWSAVTVATPAADGDERSFATMVATHFGAHLHILALTPADLDLLVVPAVRTVAPTGYSMLGGLDRAIARRAAEGGFGGLISGIGGDNVFCSLRSAAAVVDAWHDQGVRQAVRSGADLAGLTGADHWQVLRGAVRYARLDRRSPDRWSHDTRFLTAAAPPLEPHPWLAAPPGRRAGTRAHVVMLLRAHAVAAAHARARPHAMRVPLLAQPVVETCLAIPSWRWIAGGRDRAVARAAFSARLPAPIIARRSKGRLESLLVPAYDRDRARLCALLADGRLAAAGVIDREAVIAAFAAPASATVDVYIRLLELVDAELWVAALD